MRKGCADFEYSYLDRTSCSISSSLIKLKFSRLFVAFHFILESVLPLPLPLSLLLLSLSSLFFLLLDGCVKKLEMLLTMLVVLDADVCDTVLLVDWSTILGTIPDPVLVPGPEDEIDNCVKQISITDCGKDGGKGMIRRLCSWLIFSINIRYNINQIN